MRHVPKSGVKAHLVVGLVDVTETVNYTVEAKTASLIDLINDDIDSELNSCALAQIWVVLWTNSNPRLAFRT